MRNIMFRGITLVVAFMISLTFIAHAAVDTTKMPIVSNGSGNRAYWGAPFYWTTNLADFTGLDSAAAQPVFEASRDSFAVKSDMTYFFEGVYHIETTGTTAHTLATLFGGTAVIAECEYELRTYTPATEVLGADSSIWATAPTATVGTASIAAATHTTVYVSGVIRITTAGTLIPQFQYSAQPNGTTTIKKGSKFRLTPLDVVAVGMSSGVS